MKIKKDISRFPGRRIRVRITLIFFARLLDVQRERGFSDPGVGNERKYLEGVLSLRPEMDCRLTDHGTLPCRAALEIRD